MVKYIFLIFFFVGVTVAGTVQAAEVKGFREAFFGIDEKSLVDAITSDLEVKPSAIARMQDPVTQTTQLSVKMKNFAPLDIPATVSYTLGYKCHCLVRVEIVWLFPDNMTVDQRKASMIGVAALVRKFTDMGWGKDEMATGRVLGDVKEGSENTMVFFHGQNKNGGAITLTGAPVKMVKVGKGAKKSELSANVDKLKGVSLSYERDILNPDILRVDVKGF